MSTRWEHLAGDTGEFALKLAFARDPDDGQAEGFPPGAIDDGQQASRWESEWQTWWQRHALRSASEGGLFPDVILRRVRDLVEVSWGPARVEGMPEHFDFTDSDRGCSRLPPQAVAGPLHEVVSGACEYLQSLEPESPRLKKLSGRIAALRSAERHRERRLMWLAGLGTHEQAVHAGWKRVKRYLSECAEGPRRAMLKASESPLAVTGSCQAALMFGSLAPTVRKKDILEVAQVMIDLYAPEESPRPIDEIRRTVPLEASGDPPWYQAYELAEDLHERLHLGFGDDAAVNIDDVLDRVGVAVKDRELSDESIRGIALAGSQHRPGFTLAHELCHLLFDRAFGAHLAMASGPWAPRDIERRANAFAAMLLMPNQLVRRAVSMLPATLKTRADVLRVANQLQTSFGATLWHLKNLGYVDPVTRQRIELETAPPLTH